MAILPLKTEKTLSKIYFDIGHPAGYSSAYKLYKAAKQICPKLTYKQVKWWLSGHDAYTLHKPLNRKFKRRKTIASGIDYQWQTDLAVFEGISRYNSSSKYILVCIDVFSRFLFCETLKKKDSKAIITAFTKIFKKRKPRYLSSDQGKEYLNSPFQEFLRKHGVKHFVHLSDPKAAIAERVIKSVKDRLFRYFTHKNTLRYVNILPQLVKSYNNTTHSSLNEKPANVSTRNEKQLFKHQYGDYLKKTHKNEPFKPGDTVILTKIRKTFAKGYQPKWTKEKFTVIDKLNSNPPVWRVIDQDNNILEGTFYAHQLQKVR